MTTIPDYPLDIFSRDSVRDARAVDDALREHAPAVRLADGTVMIARYKDVSAGLLDWRTFSSKSRPWHDPNSVRPEILLTDDPPRHTHVRQVIAKVLSPRMLEHLRLGFEQDAAALVGELLDRQGETLDAVADITMRFVYKALCDGIGVRPEGREHMIDFSNMVWATMGPSDNDLFREAMAVDYGPLFNWLGQCCNRENLQAGGIGQALYAAADEGKVTEAEATLLLQTVLSAGADTTFLTLANALHAFSQFPEEYAKVRAEPSLVVNAFDESLRWDSPSRMAGRITTADVDIDGVAVPAGTRVGLMFAAANRDPRFWKDPDRFDVTRDVKGSVGWGYGIHACVGRVLAQLEAHVLLSELVRRVARFEPAGEPEPWMTTIGHGPAKLPVRVSAG
jgi:cytochrome P450